MAVRRQPRKPNVSFIRESDPDPLDLPRTFVDNYTDWAAGVTDAPIQYHRATGVTMLSAIMTPYISLPTSFGTFIPNIWMMVLAGTTMTRKSTSLGLAKKMLDDVMEDWMMATDGTPEGILTELQHRDGKVSVFLKDEVTGFMSSVISRDYLAGMMESFTQLYDGTEQKRVLRREEITIKNPFFIFMGGGIKTRMEEIVSMEHIRSGFIPRFLFVTGSTTKEQVRPIGPPAEEELLEDGNSPRDQVLNELWGISNYYTRPTGDDDDGGEPLIKIGGIVKVRSAPKQKHTKMKGTPEFWDRLVQLHDDAMEMGQRSSFPELYTPLYTRLANTVMKVSMLLAGAEFSPIIEARHLQKAIAYSQEWVDTVTGFALAIEQQPEMDKWEKKCDKIVAWVKSKSPQPLTQTDIMQNFRIRKRDIEDIEATLMARNLITITPYPHRRDMSGGKIVYTLNPGVHGNQTGDVLPNAIEREDSYRVTPEGYTQTPDDEDPSRPVTPKRVRVRVREHKEPYKRNGNRYTLTPTNTLTEEGLRTEESSSADD